jgi:trimeric autotransporter adhesin
MRTGILLLCLLLLGGCTPIVCNDPYIRHADGCCVDQNRNALCDSDETPQPKAMTLVDGLLAYYPEDGNHSDNFRNRNGKAYFGPVPVQGKIGGAYNYNGVGVYPASPGQNDPRVQVAVPGINDYDAVTLSAWIKLNDHPYGGSLLQFQEEAAFGHRYLSRLENWSIYAGISDGVSGDAAVTGPRMNPDEWHHYVMQWDGDVLRLYIDGELVGEQQIWSTARLSNSLWWGAGFNGWGANAAIDEIGLWNRALTPEEVRKLYNNGEGLKYPFES